MQNTSADCPLEYALGLIGGKWKMRILWCIFQEKSIRFNSLRRMLAGISDMVLTSSLKDFVEHDIVCRTQYNEIPPHVEYALTENGRALIEALARLRQWSNEKKGE